MKYLVAPAIMAGFAAAAPATNSVNQIVSKGCCGQITAHGKHAQGITGQLLDGQIRIGGPHAPSTYCFYNGAFTDSSGKGCIITPWQPHIPQFQCDEGKSSQPGFSVDYHGSISYHGNHTFSACPVNDHGEWNIYTMPIPGQDKCVEITLSFSGSCGKPKPSSKLLTSKPEPTSCNEKKYPAPCEVKTQLPASSKPSQQPCKTKKAPAPPQPTSKVEPLPCKSLEQPSQKTAQSMKTRTALERTTVEQHNGNTYVHTWKPLPTEQVTYKVPYLPRKPTTVSSNPCPSSTWKHEPQPPKSTQSHSSVPPKPTSGTCKKTSLNGKFEFPHLIIPVDSTSPNKAHGTSFNGKISPTTSSILNFDITADYHGKTCSLVFLFPHKNELETSSFTFNGQGSIAFNILRGVANQGTTYETAPKKDHELARLSVRPGNEYVVASFPCKAGTFSYELTSGEKFDLEYFQDWNPKPIGLYITAC